jgi:hypothetical protein
VPGVTPAVRSNFLLQKGDDHNSATIALRDSLDGPQHVHLELYLMKIMFLLYKNLIES